MNPEEKIRQQLHVFSDEMEKAESPMEEQRAYGKAVGFLMGLKISLNEKLIERACKDTGFDLLIGTLEA